MDDDVFQDLLAEADLLHDASRASLTTIADHSLANSTEDGASLADGMDCDYNSSYISPRLPCVMSSLPPHDIAAMQSKSGVPLKDKRSPNAPVITKIEDVFEQITNDLLHERKTTGVTLRIRRSSSQSTKKGEEQTRRLCFPGKTAEEAWRFAVVLRILELMHEALRTGVVLSKRDIFYRDAALFGSQSPVDRYVDDIAFTFGVARASLNVAAAAKGLMAGAFTLHRRDGSIVNASNDRDGMLIPALKEITTVNMKAVGWILVIEKEATFRSIAASKLWDDIRSRGVIITGKGYPDLSTRALVRFLSTPSLRNGFVSPSVYGLADFDPDGAAILSTYKHGSKALAHENEDHCVPKLKWLGLHSQHLRIGDDLHAHQGLLLLTVRDRKKAKQMLEQDHSAEADVTTGRRELQTMLMLNLKAELQILDVVPGGMLKLLRSEIPELHQP